MIAVQGLVSDQASGRRAAHVQVYGVDDRFARFHGRTGAAAPQGRDAFLSPALASDIGVSAGGSVSLRVERPSAIPIESLHGRVEHRIARVPEFLGRRPQEEGAFRSGIGVEGCADMVE